MKLDAIKNKLNELTSDDDRKDFSKIFWKPELGKSTVRIVPSAYNPDFPFTELKFHYGIAKFPMVALSNFGKQDPIEELIAELKKTSDKDNWSMAGKLSPKVRIFAPVIVRGEEDKGVRLWGFGITIYKALLSLAEDEDVGDYTDITNGWDLVVEKTKGNPYPETTVRIKPKQTPLSTKKDEVKLWLTEQPDPNDVYTQYDYDFIKNKLSDYLSGKTSDDVEEASEDTDSSLPESLGTQKADFKLSKSPAKTNSTLAQFEDLFPSDDN